MSHPRIEIEGVSIVLVGSFNPKIFQPAWFAAEGLVSREEADDAKIDIIHPEVSAFSLEWLHVEALHERFVASATQAPSFEVLRDFVIGTFSILHHTPVTMLGLNFDRHYDMQSEESWHAIGRRLAPSDAWQVALRAPGMRSLTMQGERPDGLRGAVRAKVEPSVKVRFGVYVNINDHYEIEPTDAGIVSAEAAVQIIRDRWAEFLRRPDEVASVVFGASP